jgi:hypothetical protein
MEFHYSIKIKGGRIPLHGTFRHIGRAGKENIRQGLTNAIHERWGIPDEDIEKVECYHYRNGKEITVE